MNFDPSTSRKHNLSRRAAFAGSYFGRLASITHEVNQPLAATRNDLVTALNFLDRTPPDLVEVRDALARAVKENDRTSTIVGRVRALMLKAPTRIDIVNVNEAVRGVIELT